MWMNEKDDSNSAFYDPGKCWIIWKILSVNLYIDVIR